MSDVVDLTKISSGDLVELVDAHGTRMRAVVTRNKSSMAVEFAGEERVFARWRNGRGWALIRGLKVVSVQQQLWEQ